MQNDPPFNSEPDKIQLSEEHRLDDSASGQDDPTSLAPADGMPLSQAIESVPSQEATPSQQALAEAEPPVQPASPIVPEPGQSSQAEPAVAPIVPNSPALLTDQGTVQSSQAQPAVAPVWPNSPAAPVVQGPQAGATPMTPQPGVPPGYPAPQGYYLTPWGYVPATQLPASPAGYPQSEYIPQPGFVPQTPSQPGFVPQPGYVPSPQALSQPGFPVQPGYVAQPQASSQPGFVPQTPSQPGFVPQPGYVPSPQALSQPGYVTQPGQAPVALPPGYVPPPGLAPRPPRPRLTRDRSSLLVIGGVGLVVLILLAAILGAAIHLGSSNSPGSVAGVPTISPSPTSSLGRPTSAFQAANCPFEGDPDLLQSHQLSCGYVTVPENRGVNDGKEVRLAVAIFKAQQYINSPDPDPVIRLDGGPGGPSLPDWAQGINTSDFHSFVFDHDVIMFDQRGTGYSTPSLACPELTSYQDATKGGGVAYEQAAHNCYNRLVAQGIDLNGFNSLQNAADVADIIHALGYQQMTLYGVSYGTRLALTVMRLYPSVVHSVVLDSVYPPNHNINDLPSDAQRVFTVLFQGCAKDPDCNSKYPNLQSVFYSLVAQLNANPITFYTVDGTSNQQYNVTFAGDDLISWVFTTLYVTSLIPYIPQVIFQIKNHQYLELATIYGEIFFDDTLSLGFFYSAECSEDAAFLTQQNVTQSEQGIEPDLARVLGQEDEQQEYDICQFWKVNKVPAAQKQPVTSSIPTLITTGEYDPITPPANGQEAGKTLSHSYYYEFPGQGHGQLYSSACSDQVISSFEDNPSIQPDASCISQMPEPLFV